MPRGARQVRTGGTYHVMSRGNNGQRIFQHDEDYARYLRLLTAYARMQEAQVFHFALLPTHIHLLLRVSLGAKLSGLMRGLNLSYTLYFQRRYQHTGHLWRGRFKSRLLDEARDLLPCGRYIELHPVRSGLVQEPGGYPWSSYRTYADAIFSPLITQNPGYGALGATPGERRARYRRFMQEPLEEMRRRADEPSPAGLDVCLGPDERLGFVVSRGRRARRPGTGVLATPSPPASRP